MSLRTFFNAITPNFLYRPKFNPGETVLSIGQEGDLTNAPRFEGDTLFSVRCNTPFAIRSVTSGEYTSTNPQAEFQHYAFGEPHYEVQAASDQEGFYDNYRGVGITPASRFFIAARLADSLFNSTPKTEPISEKVL